MAKYNVQIEFSGAGNNQHQEFNTELKKEKGRRIKFLAVKPAGSIDAKASYEVEGNISILDLGSLVSKISAKVNKNFSFTILRKKMAVEI